MPETNLKNGDVSAYGFMCGYVQEKVAGGDVEFFNYYAGTVVGPRFAIRMFAEGSVIHVQVRDHQQLYGLREWMSYDTITEARKAFSKAKRFYNKFDVTRKPYSDRRFFKPDHTPEWAV